MKTNFKTALISLLKKCSGCIAQDFRVESRRQSAGDMGYLRGLATKSRRERTSEAPVWLFQQAVILALLSAALFTLPAAPAVGAGVHLDVRPIIAVPPPPPPPPARSPGILVPPTKDDGPGGGFPGPGEKLSGDNSPCPAADGHADFDVSSLGFAVGELPQDLELVDLDGEGPLDVVASSLGESRVGIFLLTDTDANVYFHDTDAQPKGVTVGDFFADGVLRVLVSQADGTVLRLTPDPDWSSVSRYTYNVEGSPSKIESADLNGDGRDDFITANGITESFTLKRSINASGFQTVHIPSGGAHDFELADMDKDGDLDLVYPSGYSSATVKYRKNNGLAGFGAAITIDMDSGLVHNFFDIAVADLNLDGYPDILAVRNTDDVVAVFSTGLETFGAPVVSPANSDPIAVTVADFDADGHLDFVLAHSTNYSFTTYLGTGNGNMVGPYTFDLDGRPWAMEAVDFNGDSLPDLAMLMGEGLFHIENDAPCSTPRTPTNEEAPTREGEAPPSRPELRFFVRGDVDASGSVELTDALGISGWLFLGDDEPPCLQTADIDGDEEVTIGDISRLLNYLFQGGSAPAAPFPACGAGKVESLLDCASPVPCPKT